MPTPKPGESREDFIKRCVPIVLKDGTAEDNSQAVAVCSSMYKEEEKNMTDATKMYGEEGPYLGGATTFEELDAQEEAEQLAVEMSTLSYKMQVLVHNILNSDDIADKTTAIQDLANEFGARAGGQAKSEKAMDVGMLARIYDTLKELFTPTEPTEDSGIMFWKEADGLYHWVARYSNNFRDNDNPPEIISAKSHQSYVELVDKGVVPLPELWLWHVKEWKWGQAQWVAYDDSGFPLAGGTVDKGKEYIADMIMELPPDSVRVSHGMPKNLIVRDPDDETIIIGHVTREISPLPAWAAANNFTGFLVAKEDIIMSIPKNKRKALIEQWGITEETLNSLEAANAADKQAANGAGLESKENEENPPVPEDQAEPKVIPETPGEPETAGDAGATPLTRVELEGVVEAIGQTMSLLATAVDNIAKELEAFKEDQAAIANETLTDQFMRAIGHNQAKLDGRKKEAKQGPTETLPGNDVRPGIIATGNPFVDGLVTGIVSGDGMKSIIEGQQSEVN